MTQIDANGMCVDQKIVSARRPAIERGEMKVVSGIIVHQTGAAKASSSLNSYQSASANGAHFLIDRDGTIYQTASLYQKTWHVGKLKARCLLRNQCTPTELSQLKKFSRLRGARQGESQERARSIPFQ